MQYSIYYLHIIYTYVFVFGYRPLYFKNFKISAIALLKLVMHACSGGKDEVMGILQGKTEEGTFYVLDSFALPVQGTETRVNAGDNAVVYQDNFQTVGEYVYFL